MADQGAPKPLRARHDGFTPGKQKKFFKALRKSGCIADACRAAGISRNTVRRHRDKWPAFDARIEAALAIASVSLDMVAWKRATEGAEERVYRDGKLVMTRIKPSDAMLRLLMQGANPKKYGRTGQMPKRTARRLPGKKVKRVADRDEVEAEVGKVLEKIRRRMIADGCSEGPDGSLVPAGWKMVPHLPALPPPEGGE